MNYTATEDYTMFSELNASANPNALPDSLGVTMDNLTQHNSYTLPIGLGSSNSTGISPTRIRTMKDYEKDISDLRKENFNLKLRIYFLEERWRENFGLTENDVHKANVELKVENESMKKEIAEKCDLLRKASEALDTMEQEHAVEIEQITSKTDELRCKLAAFEKTNPNFQPGVNGLRDFQKDNQLAMGDSLLDKRGSLEWVRDAFGSSYLIQSDNEYAKSKLEEYELKLSSLDKEVEELRGKLGISEDKIKELEGALAECEARVKCEREVANSREKTVQGLVSLNKDKDREAATLRDKLNRLRADVKSSRFRTTSQSHDQVMESLEGLSISVGFINLGSKKQELDVLQQSFAQTKNQLLEKTGDCENSKYEPDEKDKMIEKLQEMIFSTEKKIQELAELTKHDECERCFAMLEAKLTEKDVLIEEMMSDRSKIMGDNEDATQMLLRALREKDDAIQHAHDNIKVKNNEIKEMTATLQEKEVELRNMTAAKWKLDSGAKRDNATTESELDLMKQVEKLNALKTSLQEQLGSSKIEIYELKLKLGSTEATVRQMSSKLKSYREALGETGLSPGHTTLPFLARSTSFSNIADISGLSDFNNSREKLSKRFASNEDLKRLNYAQSMMPKILPQAANVTPVCANSSKPRRLSVPAQINPNPRENKEARLLELVKTLEKELQSKTEQIAKLQQLAQKDKQTKFVPKLKSTFCQTEIEIESSLPDQQPEFAQEFLVAQRQLIKSRSACELLRRHLEEMATFLQKLISGDLDDTNLANVYSYIQKSQDLSMSLSQTFGQQDYTFMSEADLTATSLLEDADLTTLNSELVLTLKAEIRTQSELIGRLRSEVEDLKRQQNEAGSILANKAQQNRFPEAVTSYSSDSIFGSNRFNSVTSGTTTSYCSLPRISALAEGKIGTIANRTRVSLDFQHQQTSSSTEVVETTARDDFSWRRGVAPSAIQSKNSSDNLLLLRQPSHEQQSVFTPPKKDTDPITALATDGVRRELFSGTESDTWSEPDRNVSLQRIGLEEVRTPLKPKLGRSGWANRTSDGSTEQTGGSSSHRKTKQDAVELRRLQSKLRTAEEINAVLTHELDVMHQCGTNGQKSDMAEHLAEIHSLRQSLSEKIACYDRIISGSLLPHAAKTVDGKLLDKLELQNVELGQKLEKYHGLMVDFETALIHVKSERDSLANQLEETVDKLVLFKDTLTKVHQKLGPGSIDDVLRNIDDKAEKVAGLQKLVESLNGALTAKDILLKRGETALSEVKAKESELKNSNLKLMDLMRANNAKFSESDQLIGGYKIELENLKMKLAERERESNRLAEQNKEMTAWRTAALNSEERRCEGESKVADLEAKLRAERTKMAAELQSASEQNKIKASEFEAEASRLRESLTAMITAVTEREAELRTSHDDNKKLEVDLENISTCLVEKEQRVLELQQKVEELVTGKFDGLGLEDRHLSGFESSQLRRKEEECEVLAAKCRRREEKYRVVKGEFVKLHDTMKRLEQTCVVQESRLRVAGEMNKSLETEMKIYDKIHCSPQKHSSESKETEFHFLLSEVHALKRQLADSIKSNDQLRQLLEQQLSAAANCSGCRRNSCSFYSNASSEKEQKMSATLSSSPEKRLHDTSNLINFSRQSSVDASGNNFGRVSTGFSMNGDGSARFHLTDSVSKGERSDYKYGSSQIGFDDDVMGSKMFLSDLRGCSKGLTGSRSCLDGLSRLALPGGDSLDINNLTAQSISDRLAGRARSISSSLDYGSHVFVENGQKPPVQPPCWEKNEDETVHNGLDLHRCVGQTNLIDRQTSKSSGCGSSDAELHDLHVRSNQSSLRKHSLTFSTNQGHLSLSPPSNEKASYSSPDLGIESDPNGEHRRRTWSQTSSHQGSSALSLLKVEIKMAADFAGKVRKFCTGQVSGELRGLVSNLCVCLERSERVLKQLEEELGGGIPAVISRENTLLKEEVDRLRKLLVQEQSSLRLTADQLAANSEWKDNVEKAIFKQLSKTHKVLRRAKTNLEHQVGSKPVTMPASRDLQSNSQSATLAKDLKRTTSEL